MLGKKIRDLVCIDIDKDKTMVIACDSCGGIGNKVHDVLKVEPFITGKYTVRVGLLEVLCSGAKIISVIDNVCAEMEPTGKELIKGIKSELELANIIEVPLTGSTEENFPVSTTALGITIIGVGKKQELKLNNIRKNAKVYAIGTPKVGDEINYYKDNEIFSYESLYKLIRLDSVFEMVPVGSKGIFFEAKELAKNNNKQFILHKNINIDIERTCGPATVVIVAIDEAETSIMNEIHNSVEIGRIV